MFANVDLKKLAEMTAPERTYLSVYISGGHSLRDLEKKFHKVRSMLKGGALEKDEREYFDENVGSVMRYLEQNPLKSGSLCIFACWIIDFFKAIPLAVPVKDLVWIGSSPYIRPLAELHDEYENVAVVVADNKKAQIFLISAEATNSEEVIKGNIKNHVKKGGWSQKRYERRRDKQLHSYSHEIVKALSNLHTEENFRRILLVGGKEILHLVHESLPHELQEHVVEKHLYLGQKEGEIHKDIMDLLVEQERMSEEDLWEKIRAEYLRSGLAVIGLDDVLKFAQERRVEKMIVNRTFLPEGRKCSNCSTVHSDIVELCSACASRSLLKVDVVNEIVKMLEQTGADADFVDPIQTLTDAGEIAAHLRY
jgi:peptide subunit release factor 1 (eRF1)